MTCQISQSPKVLHAIVARSQRWTRVYRAEVAAQYLENARVLQEFNKQQSTCRTDVLLKHWVVVGLPRTLEGVPDVKVHSKGRCCVEGEGLAEASKARGRILLRGSVPLALDFMHFVWLTFLKDDNNMREQ